MMIHHTALETGYRRAGAERLGDHCRVEAQQVPGAGRGTTGGVLAGVVLSCAAKCSGRREAGGRLAGGWQAAAERRASEQLASSWQAQHCCTAGAPERAGLYACLPEIRRARDPPRAFPESPKG